MTPAQPPPGDVPPTDGALPAAALAGSEARRFGLYIHVPFCASRCGYCDFNTYTAAELGAAPGASQQAYLAAVEAEMALAARVLGPNRSPVSTVFFGGGTPTLLPPAAVVGIVAAARRHFEFAPGCEVTTEANPESVTAAGLSELRAGGVNRISFGMQSAVAAVLRVLERTHTPGRVAEVVTWARAAGFDSISLDLIYGTPGESQADWRRSLDTALATAPDHISAYSLIVEDGTRFAARVRRGEFAAPDDDDLADKYELADEVLQRAGLGWYEVSNWARPGHECRHNLGYWRGDDWWGIGPGAHSHVGGVRWWNVRHPREYSQRLGIIAGTPPTSPALGREVLSAADRLTERVLLEVRLASGLDVSVLPPAKRDRLPGLLAEGLIEPGVPVRLTRRGRLLADHVVRELA